MPNKVGLWYVYERRGGEFVLLSKPLKTKDEAEKQRLKPPRTRPLSRLDAKFETIKDMIITINPGSHIEVHGIDNRVLHLYKCHQLFPPRQ